MEIDADRVTAVLLHDGWHRVKNQSFVVEPYRVAAGGTAAEAAAVPGATWMRSKGHFISCPLTSILAVRHAVEEEEDEEEA